MSEMEFPGKLITKNTAVASLIGACIRYGSVAIIALLQVVCQLSAKAEFPAEIAVSNVDAVARLYDCDKVSISSPCAALILAPRGTRTNTDGKYHVPYHAVCHAYVLDPDTRLNGAAGYSERFLVYGANHDSQPDMLRVARLLVILWDEEHTRMRHDHSPDQLTVQVWLSEQRGAGLSSDVGGEQFKNQIYIYDVLRERRPIEWVREIAHEYGHYALPGISGFHSPEEWANGVLGERIYLKWISEETQSGKIQEAELPYITLSELNEYIAKQVDPLIRRIGRGGVAGLDLTRRDAEGMDNYTALALYIDDYYGSGQLLSAMSYTSPANRDVLAEAPDFLNGFLKSARSAPALKVVINSISGVHRQVHTIYLSAGSYSSEAHGVADWKVLASGKDPDRIGAKTMRLAHSGWYRLELVSNQIADERVQLQLSRRSGE